jgi:hypothetical protein
MENNVQNSKLTRTRAYFQTRRSPLTPLKKGGKETLKAHLRKGVGGISKE